MGAKAPPGEATESGSGPRPPNPGRGYSAGPGEQGLSQGTSCKLHWPHPGHNPQPDLRPHLLFQPFQTLLVFADLPQLLQRRVHPRQPGLQARDSSLPAPPTSGRPPLELRLPPRCLGPAPQAPPPPWSFASPTSVAGYAPEARHRPPTRPHPHFCDVRFRRSESLSRLSLARASRNFSFCTDSQVNSLLSASLERWTPGEEGRESKGRPVLLLCPRQTQPPAPQSRSALSQATAPDSLNTAHRCYRASSPAYPCSPSSPGPAP